jgi:hypothetical protein
MADSEEKLGPLTNTRLYALASIIGVIGMSMVLTQALWLMPRGEASPFLVIVFLVTPLAIMPLLSLLPKRDVLSLATRYEWNWPVVYLTLGLPAALSILSLFLIAINHDFDTISGVPYFLAIIVGADFTKLIRCLLLERDARKLHGKIPRN